jgi:hypothetical protein
MYVNEFPEVDEVVMVQVLLFSLIKVRFVSYMHTILRRLNVSQKWVRMCNFLSTTTSKE